MLFFVLDGIMVAPDKVLFVNDDLRKRMFSRSSLRCAVCCVCIRARFCTVYTVCTSEHFAFQVVSSVIVLARQPS